MNTREELLQKSKDELAVMIWQLENQLTIENHKNQNANPLDVHNMGRVELEVLKQQIDERLEDIDSKYIDAPLSWTEEERCEFFDILWTWIGVNDHTFELYTYLREAELNDEFAPPFDEHMAEFFRLFKKDIDNDDFLDRFEDAFQRERAEYAEHKRNREMNA